MRIDKNLLTNFASLGVVQFTNFVLPLITFPYLFRVVGSDHFGAIMYALNVMLYLSTFADYGFNLSAPRNVTLVRYDTVALSKTVSTVIQTKLYFFLICCIIIGISILSINHIKDHIALYGFGLMYVAGTCALPTWLFQGMENMKHITWINLVSKLISTLLIFIIVREPTDYEYVVALFGIANLLSGIIGINYAIHQYSLRLEWVSISSIYNEVRAGWYYFLSSFTSVAFSNSTVLILGFFVNNVTMGKYSIAEKIAFAVWQIITVFSQVTYPALCRLSLRSHMNVRKFMISYHLPFSIIIGLLSVTIILMADKIIILATGHSEPDTVVLLRLLCIIPFIVCLNVSAYQTLLIYEKQKFNLIIFNACVIFNVITCITLSAQYGAIGAALAAILTQIALTLSLHWLLIKRFPEYSLWSIN